MVVFSVNRSLVLLPSKKKIGSLVFRVSSGGVSPRGGELAPFLAPFLLNLGLVAKEINLVSLSSFRKDFPVVVRLNVFKDKSFSVVACPYSFFYVILDFIDETLKGSCVFEIRQFYVLIWRYYIYSGMFSMYPKFEVFCAMVFNSLMSIGGEFVLDFVESF